MDKKLRDRLNFLNEELTELDKPEETEEKPEIPEVFCCPEKKKQESAFQYPENML